MIVKHNTEHNIQQRAIIIGHGKNQNGLQKVSVATMRLDKLVKEDWYLGDMGIVPYPSGKWNEYNYTLAE